MAHLEMPNESMKLRPRLHFNEKQRDGEIEVEEVMSVTYCKGGRTGQQHWPPVLVVLFRCWLIHGSLSIRATGSLFTPSGPFPLLVSVPAF